MMKWPLARVRARVGHTPSHSPLTTLVGSGEGVLRGCAPRVEPETRNSKSGRSDEVSDAEHSGTLQERRT